MIILDLVNIHSIILIVNTIMHNTSINIIAIFILRSKISFICVIWFSLKMQIYKINLTYILFLTAIIYKLWYFNFICTFAVKQREIKARISYCQFFISILRCTYFFYYCPLNRKVVSPTPWYAEIGLPICMRQAPILDLCAFWRRFRGIGKHDIQVCIRLIKELFEVQVIH